jgi:hypothetical protein
LERGARGSENRRRIICHPPKVGRAGRARGARPTSSYVEALHLVSNEHSHSVEMYGDHNFTLSFESDILPPRPRFGLGPTALDSWTGRVAETRCGTLTPTYSHSTNSESLMSETLGWSSGWSIVYRYSRMNHDSDILPPPRLLVRPHLGTCLKCNRFNPPRKYHAFGGGSTRTCDSYMLLVFFQYHIPWDSTERCVSVRGWIRPLSTCLPTQVNHF